MSGDVQPRKRKDKKRKKDDLGVDEPRGTAAALGEGDVFMHSQHDHGTGGHWCAKVIFFSLLFILVGLIGLIILENRGLSELEANAVQSQYSGVLEGWLEDAPEDDHHDEHTLELNHHDDDHDDDNGEEAEHSEEEEDDDDDEEEHDDEDDDEDTHADDETQDDDEEEQDEDDEAEGEDDSQEQDLEANDEEEDLPYRKYYHDNEAEPDDDEDDDQDDQDDNSKNDEDEQDEQLSNEVDNDDDDDMNEDEGYNHIVEQNDDDEDNTRDNEADSNEQNEDEEEDHEDEEEDTSLEVEKIEKEAPADEEPISIELPALPEQDDDDDDDDKAQESVEDEAPEADDAVNVDDVDDDVDDANEPDEDFLEADDDEPPVERMTAPAGKPFTEVEEETSTEKPADTLADEEEYEKRQEQLRREEAEASHMWLKLSIGGALLVATHAIVRRATASSSDVPRSEERTSREETPAIDRRMTLIPEEPSEPVPIKKVSQESSRPVIQEMPKQIPSITKSSPTFEESEEEVEEEEEEPVVSKVVHTTQAAKVTEKEELYSDEEEADEEDIEEEPVVEKKAAPAAAKPPPAAKEPTPEPEEDVPDDVEIIDDEQIEEEDEEEVDDEEEISDVDDEELLTRLEAKYGRLPEPERPARRKDGGNSIEDGWPGEPADAYWRQQLDEAEREFNQGAVMQAAERAGSAQLRGSARARWLAARALDAAAERRRDNALLGRAIAAYLELLKMSERLSDKRLLEISERAINRIQFRGTYLSAEPVYRLLIRRFPDEPSHRTNLTVMFLMANRGDLAEDVLKETLKRWPNDRLALAQYGFILKTQHNRLEEALDYLQRALEGDTGAATEPRFYYHLGDTLLLLGRVDEAHEVHKRGAAHGHFLSPAQRSLYNVPRLRGRPWWRIEDTPYSKLARDLEKNWRAILKEGEAARALYEQEKEGLKERGEWSQLELFARGRELAGRCARAPVTCALVRGEPAAGCARGQVKFSAMRAGTHVRAHVGPTNCRLRMHLGLSNTDNTFIRVDREIRQWETGKVFVFDDSFEHEVWHNGTGSRLVLIVDVWHPDLTPAERRQLPPI